MHTTHINDGWLDTASTASREILDFRGEGFGPVLSLGRFHYASATEPLADQQHDAWLVLVFALAGAQHYQIGASRVFLRAGQVLRVAPGTRYGSGAWPEQRGSVAWLILDVRPLPERRELGIACEAAEHLFQRLAEPRGPVVFPQPCLAAELLECVFADWHRRESGLRRELIRHHLAALLLALATAMADADQGISRQPDYAAARIREVMDWFGDNLRNEIRVDDLAARSRLPQARFFREFKAVAGITPKDFMLRGKVDEAARLLARDASRPVTAIAHELGFSSSQYFATVFRRYLGVSPGAYRAGQRG